MSHAHRQPTDIINPRHSRIGRQKCKTVLICEVHVEFSKTHVKFSKTKLKPTGILSKKLRMMSRIRPQAAQSTQAKNVLDITSFCPKQHVALCGLSTFGRKVVSHTPHSCVRPIAFQDSSHTRPHVQHEFFHPTQYQQTDAVHLIMYNVSPRTACVSGPCFSNIMLCCPRLKKYDTL